MYIVFASVIMHISLTIHVQYASNNTRSCSIKTNTGIVPCNTHE